MNFQSFLKPIFSLIWHKRLQDYKLIKITGWRSCIMDSKSGQRIRGTFIFGNYKHLNKHNKENINTFTYRPRNPNDTSISGMI